MPLPLKQKITCFALYESTKITDANARALAYMRDNLHNFLLNDINFPSNPPLALMNAMKKTQLYIEKIIGQKDTGCQLLIVLVIDDVCICSSVGTIQAFMSSEGATMHVCVNTEHVLPGNDYEENRVLGEIAY